MSAAAQTEPDQMNTRTIPWAMSMGRIPTPDNQAMPIAPILCQWARGNSRVLAVADPSVRNATMSAPSQECVGSNRATSQCSRWHNKCSALGRASAPASDEDHAAWGKRGSLWVA